MKSASNVVVKGDPLQGHRDEPQQQSLESVDHAQRVERLVAAARALHDEDVAQVLLRAALATRQIEREAKSPQRHEDQHDVASAEGRARARMPACANSNDSR